jgi:uncharacterized membrane protein (TIGR02234 family)
VTGAPAAAPTARRELTTAVVAAAAAGGLALFAGGQTWAEITAERPAPLPPVTGVLSGADAAPLVPATGLLLLAAAVALLAVRGVGRVLLGLLLAVAGGVLAWSGLRALTGGLDDAAAEETLGRGTTAADVAAGWPALALAAGLLGAAAGVLVVLRGRGWPAMGRRYERGPGGGGAAPRAATSPARPQTDEDRAQAAWKALDRGEDPTDPAAGPSTSGPAERNGPGPSDPPPGRERPTPPIE